ncbi:DUF2809 domain-containing protein [Leifsonia sp. NPDC102414]|uniref:DUF2809 domain-containing protein n=1 Tax=Leifsonia sp. NPDC102414 TaxID=3364124 RepID=UPI003803D292
MTIGHSPARPGSSHSRGTPPSPASSCSRSRFPHWSGSGSPRSFGEFSHPAADAMYCALLFALTVVVTRKTRASTVTAHAVAASCGVEFFQLTGMSAELARHFRTNALVLATTFLRRESRGLHRHRKLVFHSRPGHSRTIRHPRGNTRRANITISAARSLNTAALAPIGCQMATHASVGCNRQSRERAGPRSLRWER